MASSDPRRPLTAAAFATLMLIALMMGGNHVAARVAFNHGVDVTTAVAFRSIITALVVAVIVISAGVRSVFTARQRWVLPLIDRKSVV